MSDDLAADALFDQAVAAAHDPLAPRCWWWLSFARPPDDDVPSEFLGVAIVWAPRVPPEAAVVVADSMGCNPGGEVIMAELEAMPALRFTNRLLTDVGEIEEAGGEHGRY